MQKRFRAILTRHEKSEATSISLPFDARAVWGKARVPVRGTISGTPFRSTVAIMGGEQFIVVNAALRSAAGVKAGDEVDIVLEPDTEVRTVEVPAELSRAFGHELMEKFERMSYTNRKEFVRWFGDAKKDETRTRRVEKMKQLLREGQTLS